MHSIVGNPSKHSETDRPPGKKAADNANPGNNESIQFLFVEIHLFHKEVVGFDSAYSFGFSAYAPRIGVVFRDNYFTKNGQPNVRQFLKYNKKPVDNRRRWWKSIS